MAGRALSDAWAIIGPQLDGRTSPVVAISTTRRRQARKPPSRLGPPPAGSPEAVRIVRSFILQQQRLRDGYGTVDAMLRKLERRRRD